MAFCGELFAPVSGGERMLLYDLEGFIEADAKEIQQLCRSPFAVSFGSDAQNKY